MTTPATHSFSHCTIKQSFFKQCSYVVPIRWLTAPPSSISLQNVPDDIVRLARCGANKLSLVCLFSLAFLVFISSCSKGSDPEAIVRTFVALCEEAAEDGNSRLLRNKISAQYNDEQGRTKQDISTTIRSYILRNTSIHIFSRLEGVTVEETNTISATVLIAMAGSPITNLSLLPTVNADMYWFDIELGKEKGEWKLVNASWRQAMLSDFVSD